MWYDSYNITLMKGPSYDTDLFLRFIDLILKEFLDLKFC